MKTSVLTAEQEHRILKFAKHCAVTIKMWPEDFDVIFEQRSFVDGNLILSSARYLSPEAEQDAVYAEVYLALKKELHPFFAKNYGPAKKHVHFNMHLILYVSIFILLTSFHIVHQVRRQWPVNVYQPHQE